MDAPGIIFFTPQYPDRTGFINFIPSLGYRRHTKRNLMWRISLTPIFYQDVTLPWIGASIGKRM